MFDVEGNGGVMCWVLGVSVEWLKAKWRKMSRVDI